MPPDESCSSGVARRRVPIVSDGVTAVGSRTRLAVLGSPISHSKSPALHAAAYGVLGLDWSFEAIEVDEVGLRGFFDGVAESWRGFAVTMPLKRAVFDHVDEVDALARRAGAINTVVCGESGRLGFNTDVYGVERALAELGVVRPGSAVLLGAGATAASVIVALSSVGTRELTLVARSATRAGRARELAESLGLRVDVVGFDDWIGVAPEVVVSSLPSSARLGGQVDTLFPGAVRGAVPLLDIGYDGEPSDVLSAWRSAGGRAESGLAMLLHQAVQQVRIFVTGDPAQPLPEEDAVVAAMRAAIAR